MQKDKDESDDNGGKIEVTVPARSKQYDDGPPPSKTKDDTSHHSSPHPSDVQQRPPFAVPKVGGRSDEQREITGGPPRKVDVPMHVTRHPEPRGRPRQREEVVRGTPAEGRRAPDEDYDG